MVTRDKINNGYVKDNTSFGLVGAWRIPLFSATVVAHLISLAVILHGQPAGQKTECGVVDEHDAYQKVADIPIYNFVTAGHWTRRLNYFVIRPSPPSRRLPRQSLSARRTPTRRRRDYAVLIVCPGWRGRGPFRVRSSAVRPSSSPSPPPPPKPTEWQEVVEAATVSVVSQSRYSAGCSDFPPYGRQ